MGEEVVLLRRMGGGGGGPFLLKLRVSFRIAPPLVLAEGASAPSAGDEDPVWPTRKPRSSSSPSLVSGLAMAGLS